MIRKFFDQNITVNRYEPRLPIYSDDCSLSSKSIGGRGCERGTAARLKVHLDLT